MKMFILAGTTGATLLLMVGCQTPDQKAMSAAETKVYTLHQQAVQVLPTEAAAIGAADQQRQVIEQYSLGR